ncbi:hypothetical protein FC758_12375 [Clostridium botulinum]|nr:hypothetical protein [Clostridium botulinum]NFL58330.1 hypothetical protein [Clostridium botulinum]NFL62580.1 hypothetical protein [Clostridium botulinum]
MAVKCLNCGYEMSTYQEVTSTLSHITSGIFGKSRENVFGGVMNQEIGTSRGVKCPKCGEVGRWEDK